MYEFKYLGWVFEESSTDEAECSRKVASERSVAGATKSLVNDRSLQLKFARVLHKSLLVPVLTYGRETVIWREKEKSWIRAVQVDNLKGLLGIRKMDRVSNAQIRQLYRVMKGVDKWIDKGVL